MRPVNLIALVDLPAFAIGNSIQLVGAVYEGDDNLYLVMAPGEDVQQYTSETGYIAAGVLELGPDDWSDFLRRTDFQEVEVTNGVTKAILRKTQRLIDTQIQWDVFRRDGYACRYCGRDQVPLTVDHLITWETGGPTIIANLLAACKRCNKDRGNLEYAEWLRSDRYKRVSAGLTPDQLMANAQIILTLATIPLEDRVRKSR